MEIKFNNKESARVLQHTDKIVEVCLFSGKDKENRTSVMLNRTELNILAKALTEMASNLSK